MELVLVIVLLGIVSLASVNFIQYGVDTYLDSASRQNMASTGRFVVERLTREIRNAVPGSVDIRDDLGDCLEFRPVDGAFAYLDEYDLDGDGDYELAPVGDNSASDTIVVMPSSSFDYDASESGYVAIIYPLNASHAYPGGGRAAQLETDGYEANGDNSYRITFDDSNTLFDASSPANRLYIAHEVVTYCNLAGQLYRFNTSSQYGSSDTPSSSDGVLMGQWFSNDTETEPMFEISASSYSASSLVQLTLRISEREEEVVLNHEIHLLQTP